MHYDYLIVGAGFFGATFARLATDAGKRCLVIDRRPHIGGNAYDRQEGSTHVHVYGPHIFHTNDAALWKFVNRFSEFNHFVLSPKAFNQGKMYSLPFNMNTFYEMWGCTTPAQARAIIEQQRFRGTPTNLEEQALSLVGTDIYEKLIRDYTRKQWQRDPRELPPEIIKRLPVRFTYDNNYFNDRYQGIPIEGYTRLFFRLLEGIPRELNVDYLQSRDRWNQLADTVVYTGKIDEYFDYLHGELEYRSLDFQHEVHQGDNYQGCAVVNYSTPDVPYTRIIEHKHFNFAGGDTSIITKEIPTTWDRSKTPYYPINDQQNGLLYRKYREMATGKKNVIFGGRLAEYRYYDMHQVIASAMTAWRHAAGITPNA